MDIKISLDNLYKVKDTTDIGTVKILMVKGEKGDTGSANVSDATGVLSLAHGGTGVTTTAEMREVFDLATKDHKHSADDITSGTLPVARGGTGATNAAGARANIGAVNLAGDTMTGALTVRNANIFRDNTNMDISADSLGSAQYSGFIFHDANGRSPGYVQAAQYTDGSVLISIGSRRFNNSANNDNALSLRMYPDGTRNVNVSSPAAWRDALGLSPTQLYNSASGVSAPTLSDSVANYARIRVFFADNHGVDCGSEEFYGLAAGSTFTLSQIEATANDGTTVRRTLYTVGSDGKTFTPSYGGYYRINHTSKAISEASTNGTNYLRIKRVEGYKY